MKLSKKFKNWVILFIAPFIPSFFLSYLSFFLSSPFSFFLRFLPSFSSLFVPLCDKDSVTTSWASFFSFQPRTFLSSSFFSFLPFYSFLFVSIFLERKRIRNRWAVNERGDFEKRHEVSFRWKTAYKLMSDSALFCSGYLLPLISSLPDSFLSFLPSSLSFAFNLSFLVSSSSLSLIISPLTSFSFLLLSSCFAISMIKLLNNGTNFKVENQERREKKKRERERNQRGWKEEE